MPIFAATFKREKIIILIPEIITPRIHVYLFLDLFSTMKIQEQVKTMIAKVIITPFQANLTGVNLPSYRVCTNYKVKIHYFPKNYIIVASEEVGIIFLYLYSFRI